jgi:hypothetical protein
LIDGVDGDLCVCRSDQSLKAAQTVCRPGVLVGKTCPAGMLAVQPAGLLAPMARLMPKAAHKNWWL